MANVSLDLISGNASAKDVDSRAAINAPNKNIFSIVDLRENIIDETLIILLTSPPPLQG